MAPSFSARAARIGPFFASALLTFCLLESARATSVSSPGRIGARKLLQSDPSVCPSELGFTACFSADGSSFNCVLDSCGGYVSIPGSPSNQPQAVRDAGTVLVDFFTAIGSNDFALYKTAVEPFAVYYPDYDNNPNAYSDGQALSVFNALRTKLNIPSGADYRSIFKVTDAGTVVSTHGGAIIGVGFIVNYPSVNPTLTFTFSLGSTSSATPSGWQIIRFYYEP